MGAQTFTGIPLASLRIETSDSLSPQTRASRLGAAIRACRTGRATQEEVAEKTGIGQTTLSAYERGKNTPTVLAVNAIEHACGRPDGWILVQAGLVAQTKTVPEAIAIDPALTDRERGSLLATYWGAVELAQHRRPAPVTGDEDAGQG